MDRTTGTNEISADLLRNAMRRFASGVTIVTATSNGESTGMTVSAFTTISLDPPIVMVSLNASGSSTQMILEAGHFAVHILATEQEDLSIRFAETGSWNEKVGGVNWSVGRSGAPILEGSATTIEAELMESKLVGTHHVLFGRVVHVELTDITPDAPLLYYDRNYRTLDRSGEHPHSDNFDAD